MDYIYFSPFLGPEEEKAAHGGVKRSLQIKELLEEYNCININPYFSIKKCIKHFIKSPFISFKVFFYAIYLFLRKGVSIKGMFLFMVKTPFILKTISQNKLKEYIFEGGTTLSILIIHYLSFLRLNYHIFPQNIVFIEPKGNSDNYFRSNLYKYSMEIEVYKYAKSVTTVSNFDQAILACHQINSFLLYSFPTTKSQSFFETIAKKRKDFSLNQKNIKNKKILLIGSTSAYHTRRGLINILENLKITKFPYQVNLVGYGTSEFKSYNSKNINVLGSVTNSKLEELMIEADCLIVNTIQASGYLFKVVEFNLSGIPIIFTSKFIQHENLEEYGIFNIDINNLYETILKIDEVKSFKKFKKKNITWL